MPKSTYLCNKLLDLPLSATAFTAPATLYLALYTSAPTVGGGGTEVSGGAYARVAITNNSTNFPAASAAAKASGATFTFPTASASWGVVTAIGILDASSAGNLLYFTTITSKTVDPSDTVSIASGALTFSET